MTYRWYPNADRYSWTVLWEEVAPHVNPTAKEKYQTWFIAHCPQPDGVCMNCRKRRGDQDPISGTYTCDDCQRLCDAGMAEEIRKRKTVA